jgi:hypothetical protein
VHRDIEASPSRDERTRLEGRAHWIWSAEGIHRKPEPGSPSHYEVRYFRRAFDAPDGAELRAHVTADSRYVLYVNGRLAGRGPAKGDVAHHFYETCDLGEMLVPGRNVLAAVVLDFSRVECYPPDLGAPASVMAGHGGFLLEGTLRDRAGACLEDLGTNAGWRVAVDRAYRFHSEGNAFGGFVGYFERYVAAEAPHGWTTAGFDDSGWDRPWSGLSRRSSAATAARPRPPCPWRWRLGPAPRSSAMRATPRRASRSCG